MFLFKNLLHNVVGSTSFENLRSVNGNILGSYREACQELGLLKDDKHWDDALNEANETKNRVKSLFSIILTSCNPSNPQYIWKKYKKCMSEDILYRNQKLLCDYDLDYTDEIFNEALIILEDICLIISGKNLDHWGITSPLPNNNITDSEIIRETSYDVNNLDKYINDNKLLLIDDQNKS